MYACKRVAFLRGCAQHVPQQLNDNCWTSAARNRKKFYIIRDNPSGTCKGRCVSWCTAWSTSCRLAPSHLEPCRLTPTHHHGKGSQGFCEDILFHQILFVIESTVPSYWKKGGIQSTFLYLWNCDRPHALLWLAKCYAIPASMYACQIWGTWFTKQGSEFDSPLQTAHLCFFKGVLGVKRPRPTGLCCESVARSLCSIIGSTLLPRFSTLCLAGLVACSRRLCMRTLL